MDKVEKVIEKWKRNLLDLSKRNQLIFFKDTKRSTLKLTQPTEHQLFTNLVHKRKVMEFAYRELDWTKLGWSDSPHGDKELSQISINSKQILTNREDNELFITLNNLKNKAKSSQEERGINILFLSFGFLEWKESPNSSIFIKSPLLMVPVSLTQNGLKEKFSLKMIDEEIIINPTLTYKLEKDFNLILPAYSEEEEISFKDYLRKMDSMSFSSDWKVVKDVYLGLFSYNKMKMYQDLHDHVKKVSKHHFVRALCGEKDLIKNIPIELQNLDHDSLKPFETYQVLDADSSQLDAITAVSKGHSIVLHGPPGTGKSQTIANIIADSLARKKKVLFVSEKTAALNVVYQRLNEANLSNFCFQLHSSKMNKKDAIETLKETLLDHNIALTTDAFRAMDKLENHRNNLNNYVRDLHQKHPTFSKSLYEMHGLALHYRDYPDIIFSLNETKSITQKDMEIFREVLEEFERTSKKLGNTYQSNCWYGSNIEELKRTIQHDMQTNYQRYRNKLSSWITFFNAKNHDIMLSICPSYDNISSILSILDHVKQSPDPLFSWFEGIGLLELKKKTDYNQNLFQSYFNVKSILQNNYKELCHELMAEKMLCEINHTEEEMSEFIARESLDQYLPPDSDRLDSLSILSSEFHRYIEIAHTLTRLLSLENVVSLEDAENLYQLIKTLVYQPLPVDKWLNPETINEVKDYLSNVIRILQDVNEEKELVKAYDEDILTINAVPLIHRFRTDYRSFIKWFKPSYYNDKKILRAYSKNPSLPRNDKDWEKLLLTLRRIQIGKKWLHEHHDTIKDILGSKYKSLHTPIEDLKKSFMLIENLMEWFSGNIPPQIKSILKNPTDFKEIIHEIGPEFIKFHESEISKHLFSHFQFTSREVQDIKGYAEKTLAWLNKLRILYRSLLECRQNVIIPSLNEVKSDLRKISDLQKYTLEIQQSEKSNLELYQHFYEGFQTDWNKIQEALDWGESLTLKLGTTLESSKEFISFLCHNKDASKIAAELSFETNQFLKESKDDFDYIQQQFDFSLISFEKAPFKDILIWLDECLSHFYLLEEWIDFRKAKEKCEKHGLKEFIQKAMEKNIPPEKVIGAFFKRFYLQMIDDMNEEYLPVKDFRGKKHASDIEKFKIADKNLFTIMQLRVQENCLENRPPVNTFTVNTGEIGILNKEINKKSRQKPLRILFKQIPNLLLSIKPCLMMSPLSVSLLLDPDLYEFDIVIFDEASQICTEDAIGSIYRSKQVVIAGDSEQLPPTNFFSVTSYDMEDDYDEDIEDDTNAYESILDQARTVLPEIKLLWHYRSKHEHLIAFSNAMIYDHSLITFPSQFEKVKNLGVEYYHVSDAHYDRGKKKHNLKEAEKMVELTIDHIKNKPHFSLGIVALSNAQQQAIEEALRRFRLKNTAYEFFFTEHKEEAFFVKNLESVQGDERDVILLSIGYGRDSSGAMSLNFGPLNKSGGYRRLNVAITRSKFNLKLVGSIFPGDIDVSKTEARGTILLKKYIEYALNGPKVLPAPPVHKMLSRAESPFEEEVLKFLLKHDYMVDAQVGCSGFRIDLAVRDPKTEGKYVLGIECDGASYHSARTARERDRLRQALLEDRGWKLYRIWSTDWIKDFPSESRRLIKTINSALNGGEENSSENSHVEENPNQDQYYQKILPEDENIKAFYGFSTYTEFDLTAHCLKYPSYQCEKLICTYPDCGSKQCKRNQTMLQALLSMLKIQGPTSFDEICRKLVFFYKRQKVSKPIKEKFLHFLSNPEVKKQISTSIDFYSLVNDPVKVRIPHGKETSRNIDQIPPQELELAVKEIKNKHMGISNDEIISTLLKLYGFNRFGPKIQQALSTFLQQ